MCAKRTSVVLRDGPERHIVECIDWGERRTTEGERWASASVIKEDIDDDGSEFEEECCENWHMYMCLIVNEYGWREGRDLDGASGGLWRDRKVLFSAVVVPEGGYENGADGDEDLS